MPSFLAALATFALVAGQMPAQSKPDFSGRWTVQSGLESWGVERFTIAQTPTSIGIRVTQGNAVRLNSRTFRIEDTGSRASSTSEFPRAYWINDALAIDSQSELEVYAFDRQDRLVVMRVWTPLVNGIMGTSRVIYQRE